MTPSNSGTRPGIVPSIGRADRGLVRRLLSAILSHWPERTRGSPPVPNVLRRDVGLDPIEPGRKYWDRP